MEANNNFKKLDFKNLRLNTKKDPEFDKQSAEIISKQSNKFRQFIVEQNKIWGVLGNQIIGAEKY